MSIFDSQLGSRYENSCQLLAPRANLLDLPVELAGSKWSRNFLNADEADGGRKDRIILQLSASIRPIRLIRVQNFAKMENLHTELLANS